MHIKITQEVINHLNGLDDKKRFEVAMDVLASLIATLSEAVTDDERLFIWNTITKAMHIEHEEHTMH